MTVVEVSAPVVAAHAKSPSRWRRWRKSRPFWGGVLTIAGGLEVTLIPLGAYRLVMISPSIVYAIVSGLLLVILGLAVLMTPQHSRLYGMFIVLAAVLSFLMSNLGGFLLGALLGILGGALVFGWDPPVDATTGGATVAQAETSDTVVLPDEDVDVRLADLMDVDLREGLTAAAPTRQTDSQAALDVVDMSSARAAEPDSDVIDLTADLSSRSDPKEPGRP